MNLEILESRTLLAGDTAAQEPEVDIEEQACSLSNLKPCSLLQKADILFLNAVIAPFALTYDMGAEAANLVTGLSELAIDTATCTLSPSEENCTPHRDLNGDVVKMIGGTVSTLTTTYFATKQLHSIDTPAAILIGTSVVTLGQAAESYHVKHGGKPSIQRVANSLKELKSYFSDESSTPIKV